MYPFLPFDYFPFIEIQANHTGKHDLKMKNVEVFKFWDKKPECKILDLS